MFNISFNGNLPVCLAQSIMLSLSQTLVLPPFIIQSGSGRFSLLTIIDTCVVGTCKIFAISLTPTMLGFSPLERGIVWCHLLGVSYWSGYILLCRWSSLNLYVICTYTVTGLSHTCANSVLG